MRPLPSPIAEDGRHDVRLGGNEFQMIALGQLDGRDGVLRRAHPRGLELIRPGGRDHYRVGGTARRCARLVWAETAEHVIAVQAANAEAKSERRIN